MTVLDFLDTEKREMMSDNDGETKRSIRLTILANSLYTFGGGERWVLESSTRMKRFVNINILYPVSRNDEHRVGINTLRKRYNLDGIGITALKCTGTSFKLPGSGKFLMMIPKLGSVRVLGDAIRSSDVVYAVSFNPFLLLCSMFFAWRYWKRFILGLHNPDFMREETGTESMQERIGLRIAKALQEILIMNTKYIHAQTETQVRTLERIGYRGRIFYIPHFLYLKPKAMREVRNRKKFVVLFVGRLDVAQKGIDLLDRVVRKTLSRSDSVEFHIVGSGDGEDIVRKLSSEYKDRVRWYGFVSEKKLEDEYASADLFMLTSRYETPGLSLLEAQGYGLPAVTFDVMGPRDIMKNRLQGFRIRPFDIDSFSDTIIDKLHECKKDRSAYNTNRLEIRKMIAQRYYDRNFTEKFLGMLRHVGRRI